MKRHAFTLVEMLIAVAITLVMMAAVVALFASITNSVRNRRATIEMSGQLRHVRNMLQKDLAAATCPGQTWQRPESNHGYIELIEGVYRDTNPSMLTDGLPDSDMNGNPDIDSDGQPDIDELDAKQSGIPRNNAVTDANNDGRIDDDEVSKHLNSDASLAGLNGLGDYDDILMLTARNEHEPYVGRAPSSSSSSGYASIETPLAEVIWFSIENPSQAENNVAGGFFGEPGMRTIYRRTLLIAPWFNPTETAPGLLEVLPDAIDQTNADRAIAALIRFQDAYDLSVRLEWDPLADSGMGRWKIIANTLADLTKRENRFAHYGYVAGAERRYPFAAVSAGGGYPNTRPVTFVYENGDSHDAQASASSMNGSVVTYTVTNTGTKHDVRPFAYVPGSSGPNATANAMLDDDGKVVRVLLGPVPLWGLRRGQDVMLTNVLGFDIRVFDPGSPIYQESSTQTVLEPADPGWRNAYNSTLGTAMTGHSFVGQGAYVDMGYTFGAPAPIPTSGLLEPWFAVAKALSHVDGTQLAPGFAVYDTWSLSYENNGWDEDGDGLPDEGTNGLDDVQRYVIDSGAGPTVVNQRLYGVDDFGERETAPPYDKPLRGVQIVLRTYESDARQIRQVRVNQHFMGE